MASRWWIVSVSSPSTPALLAPLIDEVADWEPPFSVLLSRLRASKWGAGYGQAVLMPSQDRQSLINMVRCGDPELMDLGLQELLQRSRSGMAVANWKGLLEMCFEVLERWLSDVEEEHHQPSGGGGHKGRTEMSWGASTCGGEADDRHATDVLLILRNLMDVNPIEVFLATLTRPTALEIKRRKAQSRPRMLAVMERLLAIPSLPELALAQPELVLYVIEIVAATPRRFLDNAPLYELFDATSDIALILPLIRIFRATPAERLPRARLLDKLLPFTTLTGAAAAALDDDDLLSHALDLIYHLTAQPPHALAFLRRPDAATWLRSLTTLIDNQSRTVPQYAARKAQCQAEWVPPLALAATGGKYHVQADGTLHVPVREDDGKPHSQEHLGLGPVIAIPADRLDTIRRLKEVERATVWMKQVIVYQPQSAMTQLTFWSAYREFIQDAASASMQEALGKTRAQGLPDSAAQPDIPPMANAQEVIKLAQQVFPAQAQVVTSDENGNPLPASKYLLVGLKFRRSVGRYETFACRWEGCTVNAKGDLTKPSHLQSHLELHHAGDHRCRWHGIEGGAACSSSSSSKAHLATHIPLDVNDKDEPRGRLVVRHPTTRGDVVKSGSHVTFREPPEPPHTQQLSWRVKQASVEATPDGEPHAGPAYRSAIVLRNLARALKEDLEAAEDQEDAQTGTGPARGKRRKLERNGAFGLPAPDSILEAANGAGREPVLTYEERDRARAAFVCVVEPKALEWVAAGDAIAKKLGDCMGWS